MDKKFYSKVVESLKMFYKPLITYEETSSKMYREVNRNLYIEVTERLEVVKTIEGVGSLHNIFIHKL